MDAFYESLVAHGATVEKPPENYDYGIRDFAAIDPWGHRLVFGEPFGPKVV